MHVKQQVCNVLAVLLCSGAVQSDMPYNNSCAAVQPVNARATPGVCMMSVLRVHPSVIPTLMRKMEFTCWSGVTAKS